MRKTALLFYALFFGVQPAQAAMTGWTAVQGGAVRLIATDVLEDGHYLAGLEFSLEPGWHTYWRYPGEAGIPPQITLSETANLKAHEVLYPVPERYNDGFSTSIVYHDGIVLPLRLVPEDPAQPVRVSMDLFFGICKEVCVPGDAVLTLELAPDAKLDPLASKLITRDLNAVPGVAPADDLAVSSVQLSSDKNGVLEIETYAGGADTLDLFAAGPEGSFIGLPALKTEQDGSAVWQLSTKGLKTTGNDQNLRLVLTSNGAALEHLEPIQPEWVD